MPTSKGRTEDVRAALGCTRRSLMPLPMTSIEELEDELSRPGEADVEFLRHLDGDILILGAAGKMGPSLARLCRRGAGGGGGGRGGPAGGGGPGRARWAAGARRPPPVFLPPPSGWGGRGGGGGFPGCPNFPPPRGGE